MGGSKLSGEVYCGVALCDHLRAVGDVILGVMGDAIDPRVRWPRLGVAGDVMIVGAGGRSEAITRRVQKLDRQLGDEHE